MKKTYLEMTEEERIIERDRIKNKVNKLQYKVILSVHELSYIHQILTETKCKPAYKQLHDKLLRKLR